MIDGKISVAIDEIRSRFEDEGIGVEYRTCSTHPHPNSNGLFGKLYYWGKYIRPTRVVVFYYLDDVPTTTSTNIIFEGMRTSSIGELVGADDGTIGERSLPQHRTKKTSSFFSEDYQRKYFPPRSVDETSSVGVAATMSSPASPFSLV